MVFYCAMKDRFLLLYIQNVNRIDWNTIFLGSYTLNNCVDNYLKKAGHRYDKQENNGRTTLNQGHTSYDYVRCACVYTQST